MISCENCRRQPATLALTRVRGSEVTVEHLCGACAAVPIKGDALELLASLIAESLTPPAREPILRRCPECGLDFGEFAKTHLLGCPNCYRAFAESLAPVLKHLGGGARHGGKIPARAASAQPPEEA